MAKFSEHEMQRSKMVRGLSATMISPMVSTPIIYASEEGASSPQPYSKFALATSINDERLDRLAFEANGDPVSGLKTERRRCSIAMGSGLSHEGSRASSGSHLTPGIHQLTTNLGHRKESL
jgi:hypothetical protein